MIKFAYGGLYWFILWVEHVTGGRVSDFPCIPVLYMGASESKQEEDHTEQLIRNVKIALVGTYGVGKTSIITRYIDQKFSSEYIYTRGKCMSTILMRTSKG